MSVYSGPEIPNNGLVFSIDSGNDKSYSRNHFLALNASSPSDASATFGVQGTGTFTRLGYGQTIGNYTIKQSDVVYKYNLDVTGCHYHGHQLTIPAGLYATFSFDYYVSTDAVNLGVSPNINYLANFEGALSGAWACPNFNLGVWQRISGTVGPSTAGNLNMLLYPGACSSSRLATGGYILYRNPIVEFTNSSAYTGVFSTRTSNTTVNDISGTNYSCTLTNGTVKVNDYFQFDGTDDYITTNYNPTTAGIVGDVSYTISAWIYLTSSVTLGAGACIFGNDDLYGIGLQIFPTNTVNFGYRSTGNFSAGTLSLNTWYHVVGVKVAGTDAYIYINGTLAGSYGSNGLTVIASSVNALIGWGPNRVNGQYFPGRISSIQVYNRALSSTEVKQNYNAMRGRFGL